MIIILFLYFLIWKNYINRITVYATIFGLKNTKRVQPSISFCHKLFGWVWSSEVDGNQTAVVHHDTLGTGSHNTSGRVIYNISYVLPSQFDFISPWRLTSVSSRPTFGYRHLSSAITKLTLHHIGVKGNERSFFDWPWLKSAVTHLLIVFSSYFTTEPGCATDAPAFVFTKLPKNNTYCAPCSLHPDKQK